MRQLSCRALDKRILYSQQAQQAVIPLLSYYFKYILSQSEYLESQWENRDIHINFSIKKISVQVSIVISTEKQCLNMHIFRFVQNFIFNYAFTCPLRIKSFIFESFSVIQFTYEQYFLQSTRTQTVQFSCKICCRSVSPIAIIFIFNCKHFFLLLFFCGWDSSINHLQYQTLWPFCSTTNCCTAISFLVHLSVNQPFCWTIIKDQKTITCIQTHNLHLKWMGEPCIWHSTM